MFPPISAGVSERIEVLLLYEYGAGSALSISGILATAARAYQYSYKFKSSVKCPEVPAQILNVLASGSSKAYLFILLRCMCIHQAVPAAVPGFAKTGSDRCIIDNHPSPLSSSMTKVIAPDRSTRKYHCDIGDSSAVASSVIIILAPNHRVGCGFLHVLYNSPQLPGVAPCHVLLAH